MKPEVLLPSSWLKFHKCSALNRAHLHACKSEAAEHAANPCTKTIKKKKLKTSGQATQGHGQDSLQCNLHPRSGSKSKFHQAPYALIQAYGSKILTDIRTPIIMKGICANSMEPTTP